jgi:hypothetical protein
MRASFNLTMVLLVGCGGATAPGVETTSRTDSGAASDASKDASPYASNAGGVVCTISASNYDQSCSTDTECAMVSSGDYCDSDQCFCGGSAISVGALAQFSADVAKTPIGTGAIPAAFCGCPLEGPPCCRAGVCTTTCSSPNDTLPACADAGGICMPPNVTCGTPGPSNTCAYADEPCCIAPGIGAR